MSVNLSAGAHFDAEDVTAHIRIGPVINIGRDVTLFPRDLAAVVALRDALDRLAAELAGASDESS